MITATIYMHVEDGTTTPYCLKIYDVGITAQCLIDMLEKLKSQRGNVVINSLYFKSGV